MQRRCKMGWKDVIFTVFVSSVISYGCLTYFQYNGDYKQTMVSFRNLRINGNRITFDYGERRQEGVVKDTSVSTQVPIQSHNELKLSYESHDFDVLQKSLPKAECYDFTLSAKSSAVTELVHCYNLGKAHWYGGFEHVYQPWPIEKIVMDQTPYVSGDLFFHGIPVGGVLERLFFNSDGFGFYVPDEVPLYVSINSSADGLICLAAKNEGYPYLNTPKRLTLSYTVCKSTDARIIRSTLLDRYYQKSELIPDEQLFYKPIWCTWAQYNKNVNETAVRQYAQTILKHDFTFSQIEVDDDWTPFYGDLEFNRKKFPDPRKMITDLNDKGFRITLWMHPFAELNSSSFTEGASKGFFIRSRGDRVPALVRWWNGEMAAILDVTNSHAVDWFLKKLQRLRDEYGVSSLKFDAGESFYLPRNYDTKEPLNCPDDYARLWATLAYRFDHDIRHQEVRVGFKSQNLPIFVRMFDRSSTWKGKAGMQTLIPTVLTFGLLGYPFVLADMVGGNAYADLVEFKGGAYPERELFIRWMEINAFFPTIQYSIAPWIYDEEVIQLCKKYTNLHEKYAPLMIKLAKESTQTGDPIIRPIWWNSPQDEIALVIDSEFLVGDGILVAPVLEEGKRSRDVYLPQGQWKDMLRGGQVQGPKWIYNYKVELSELSYFMLDVG